LCGPGVDITSVYEENYLALYNDMRSRNLLRNYHSLNSKVEY